MHTVTPLLLEGNLRLVAAGIMADDPAESIDREAARRAIRQAQQQDRLSRAIAHAIEEASVTNGPAKWAKAWVDHVLDFEGMLMLETLAKSFTQPMDDNAKARAFEQLADAVWKDAEGYGLAGKVEN